MKIPFASLLMVLLAVHNVQSSAGAWLTVQDAGTVEGLVVGANQEPLRNAKVFLQELARPPAYSIASDASGRFVFKDVVPGRYFIAAERNGYLHQNYDEFPIRVTAGQHITNIVLALRLQAIIHGRVVNNDGEPMSRIDVQVLRQTYRDGSKQLLPVAWGRTQDDGTFVIGGLPAGRYYVNAAPSPLPSEELLQDSGAARGETYVATYWPGEIDFSSAVPIVLATGADARNIDIHLRQAQVFRIRGRVVMPDGLPAQRATLSLRQLENGFPSGMNVARSRSPEGAFEFDSLLPGTFVLQATLDSEDSSSPRLFGRVSLTVGNRDVDDVQVQLGRAVQVRGNIRIEGSAVTWATPPQVLLTLRGGNGSSVSARVQADGTFELSKIAPDVYNVKLVGLSDTSYVKSFTIDGLSTPGGLVDLTPGAKTIQILVSSAAGDVTGVARTANGGLSSRIIIQIFDEKAKTTRSVPATQDGGFRIGGLAPGEYSLIAWEGTEPDLSQDPTFRTRFQKWAISVSVQEGAHASASLVVVPTAAVNQQ